MFYGIISPDREREYFDACYDMLTTILIGEMSMPNGPSSTQSFTDTDKKAEIQRNRLNSTYNKLVIKIKVNIDKSRKIFIEKNSSKSPLITTFWSLSFTI